MDKGDLLDALAERYESSTAMSQHQHECEPCILANLFNQGECCAKGKRLKIKATSSEWKARETIRSLRTAGIDVDRYLRAIGLDRWFDSDGS